MTFVTVQSPKVSSRARVYPYTASYPCQGNLIVDQMPDVKHHLADRLSHSYSSCSLLVDSDITIFGNDSTCKY